MLWGALIKQQRQGVIDTINAEVLSLEHEFQTLVSSQISDLQRSAREWEIHGQPNHDLWQTSADMLVRDHHGLEAVCTATPHGKLQTIDASSLPREALDTLIAHEQAALKEAGETGQMSVVKPFDPEVHGHGFVVNVPVGKGHNLKGFVVGFFHFQPVMETVLNNNVDDLHIQIADRQGVAYENDSASADFRPLTRKLDIFGSEWLLLCRPTPALLAREASGVVNFVLVIGAVICWLLAVTVGLMIKARLREAHVLRGQEKLAYYSGIVKNSQDAIITTTREGEITKWNESAEALYGYTSKEALGQHICMLDPPNRPIEEDELYARACAGEWVPSFDTERKRKDGSCVSVSLNESPVVLGGEIVGVSYISRDISERKAAEEALTENATLLHSINDSLNEAYAKAEAATKAKSAFLSNMSHEIRAPLTDILSYAEIARQLSEHDQAVEAIETIERNGGHLLEIFNDILDLSEIESEQLEIAISDVEVAQLFNEATELMNVRAAAKSLPLELRFATPLPETIPSDATRLRQIIINLVANAIKFTEGGFVRIEVSFDQTTRDLSFSVIDTGVGMSGAHLQGLFAAFSHQDKCLTSKKGGLGLGLAISKRLTELLGGRIQVESTLGKGSRFTVHLPVPADAEIELTTPSSNAPVQAENVVEELDDAPQLDCRILLAEDGPDNQRLLAFVLRRAGANVTVVENGQLAVEQALGAIRGRRQGDPQQPYDIILMDMQMPVMNGYQATERLREHGFDRPIVALTAHGGKGEREKCLAVGCSDFVTKPVPANQLVLLVAKNVLQTANATS